MKKTMLVAVVVCMFVVSATAIASNTEGGTVKAAILNSTTVWESGTMVSLTAVPDLGWRFDHWAGADVGDVADPNSSQTTIIMNGNKAIQAIFVELPRYTLSASTGGNGSVTKSPDQADYIEGTAVSVTAVPDLGWQFDHWTGDLSGSANSATVVMDADKSIAAVFTAATPDAPVITSQPVDQIVGPGQTATFSVVATGVNLKYQWYKDGAVVNEATAAQFSFVADEVYEGGYYCVVSNAGGSVTSDTAKLYVNSKPLFAFEYTDGSGLLEGRFNANGADESQFVIGLGANESVVGVGLALMWPTDSPANFALEIEALASGLPVNSFSEVLSLAGTDCLNSSFASRANFSLEVVDAFLAYPVFQVYDSVTKKSRILSGNTAEIDLTLNGEEVALVGGNYELLLGGQVVMYSLNIETIGLGTASASSI